MDAVRPLVWSRWRAALSITLPPAAAAALAASLKGSRCCSAAADAAAGLPDGSLWCREFGKPRLTRRYPPYPEMAQNLLITFIVLFWCQQHWLGTVHFFPKWCNSTAIPMMWPKSAIFVKVVSKYAVALWCIHCHHWYSSFGHFFFNSENENSLQIQPRMFEYPNHQVHILPSASLNCNYLGRTPDPPSI